MSSPSKRRPMSRLWDPPTLYPKRKRTSSTESTIPPKKKDRKVVESSSGETSTSARHRSGSESSSGSGYDTSDEEFKEKIKDFKKKAFDLSYSVSTTKDEDIEYLKTIGLNITANILGKGDFGEVFQGIYGKRAKALKDIKGESLRNVVPGTEFAAKYIDLKAFARRIQIDVKDSRDRYETEKQIMKFTNHRNIVSIRFVIHMGPTKQHKLEDSTHKYIAGDRVWMIMDYADQGNLEDYIQQFGLRLYQQCLEFAQQLFSGLQYLHNNCIIHGDIKAENVLLFTEDNKTVVKWCDFGLGTMFSIQTLTEDTFENSVSKELKIFSKLLKKIVDKCKEVQVLSDSEPESNEPQGSDTGESTSMGATGGLEAERSESESNDSETDEESASGPSFGVLIRPGGHGEQYVDPVSHELDRIHKLESEAKRRLKELIKELESGKNLDQINTKLQIFD